MGGRGKVYLVGAGPGDIGLLTVKGLRCLQEADVVVYDFHLNAQVLNYIKHEAEFIYAGKRGGHHEMTQDEINRVMVEKAREGKVVCRLKGGDPFVFGRGGEEAEVLAEEGIEFEVVPGVSSAIAAPAYAGVPLTHRQLSSSIVIVPGSEASTKPGSKINWKALASIDGTLVFLMAIKNIQEVVDRLIGEGKDPETPVAVVRWGTRADQRTVLSTLRKLPEEINNHEIRPPAVVVVGEVVRLRQKLNWFERKPLFGQRILITRESMDAYRRLEELGAELFQFPTLKVVPPAGWDDLDRCIEGVNRYHWIVFTSANGVSFFFQRFFQLGRDIRELSGIRLCAIGSKTEEALRGYGLRVDLVPESFRAEGLVDAFASMGSLQGIRFLIPRAEVAREVLPEALIRAGAEVDTPTAYRAVKPTTHAKRLRRFLQEGKITVATFTSGATFRNFCEMLGDDARELLRDVKIAVIGPVTAKAIESEGLRVDIMPEEATVEAMVEEIIRHLGGAG